MYSHKVIVLGEERDQKGRVFPSERERDIKGVRGICLFVGDKIVRKTQNDACMTHNMCVDSNGISEDCWLTGGGNLDCSAAEMKGEVKRSCGWVFMLVKLIDVGGNCKEDCREVHLTRIENQKIAHSFYFHFCKDILGEA